MTEPWNRHVAEGYDEASADMYAPDALEPAVAFLAALAPGGRVLELAIGTGRVALPLVGAGLAVSGVDSSRATVDVLRRKPGSDAIEVVIGDMTTTRVPGEFDLVHLVFNGITNLLTQAEQVECFRNAARHLRPAGRRAGWTRAPFTAGSGSHVSAWRRPG